jgi:TrpR-related protein YerC/YecD
MSISTNDKNGLYKAILALKNEDECRRFLRDLLTEPEINEFTNRWKVARMLNQKIQYEMIAAKTGMSSTTIARISKWLNNGMGGYKLILKRLDTKNHSHASLSAA